jgi:hypothetical protein
MDERDFFDEKEARKPHTLACPHCHQSNEYELAWLVRTKRKQLPGRADERDRAKFAKARSYMVRRDDVALCKNMRCRKRFEVAGVQSVVFADEPVQSNVNDRAARISGSFSPRPKPS